MGLISFFKNLREKYRQRSIRKNRKALKNAKIMHEERAAAIKYFASLDDPRVAAPILLQRFDFSLDHGINDTREKEAAMQGLIELGKETLPYIKAHLKATTRIAWPIKVLQQLTENDAVIEVLRDMLELGEIDFDKDKIDKNYDIMCYLRDYSLADGGEFLLAMMKAHDERIRFAATEAIAAQENEAIVGTLEKYIADDSAENSRIRQVLTECYARNGWKLKDSTIPAGPIGELDFEVTEGRSIKKI